MQMECSAASGAFQAVSGRKVVAEFDGGPVTSDAGALLPRQADAAVGPVDRLRLASRIIATVALLSTMSGRSWGGVFGIAPGPGYEAPVDHDALRHDPIMAVSAGKLRSKRSDCAPVAGKSTLNRLEPGGASPAEYRKIVHDCSAIEGLFVDAVRGGARGDSGSGCSGFRRDKRSGPRDAGGAFFPRLLLSSSLCLAQLSIRMHVWYDDLGFKEI